MIRKNLSFLILVCVMICFCFACHNGQLAFASNKVSQVNGVKVELNKSTQKVFILGQDSEERVGKFGEFGKLTLINVSISGEFTKEHLGQALTGVKENADGSYIMTNNADEIEYYADLFQLKIRLPKGATKVNELNGKGAVKIDTGKQVDDGYFYKNLIYIVGNKEKTEYKPFTDNQEDDKYYYLGFSDDNGKILSQMFIRIQYSIEVK